MSNSLYILATELFKPENDLHWRDSLPPAIKRKDPRIWQIGYTVTKRILERTQIVPKSIIVGTALGALDETCNFLNTIFIDGFASPRNFIASVHNSTAGKIALDFKISGPNLTFCDGPNTLVSCFKNVSFLNDDCFPALVLFIDEKIELFHKLKPFLSQSCSEKFISNWDEVCVAFLVTNANNMSNVKLSTYGPFTDNITDQELQNQYFSLNESFALPSITTDSLSAPVLVLHNAITEKQSLLIKTQYALTKCRGFLEITCD